MLALTVANLKMLARNRHSTFWALFFPLLLVVVFGLFDISTVGSADLVIVDEADTPQSRLLAQKLAGIEFLKLEQPGPTPSASRQRVAQSDLDYFLLIPQGFGEANPTPSVALVSNTGNPDRNQLVEGTVRNLVAESLPGRGTAGNGSAVVSESLEIRQVDYFDLVLVGLVGMGIMVHSIIAIAVKISTYRNLSILKRMLVTPLAIWKYFASEIAAHLVLALFQAAIILAVGVFVFGARLHGNVLYLVPIILLGSLIFLNIGFILSAWAKTPSAASGMGNVLALPMMFFAGTFFPTTILPSVLPYVAEALPLTPMLSALREIAIGSAPLWEVWPQLAVLSGWVAATALVAVKVFRFS
ncbi:MAG: ABC transporter permease [Dehalococcoidia bacterium]